MFTVEGGIRRRNFLMEIKSLVFGVNLCIVKYIARDTRVKHFVKIFRHFLRYMCVRIRIIGKNVISTILLIFRVSCYLKGYLFKKIGLTFYIIKKRRNLSVFYSC